MTIERQEWLFHVCAPIDASVAIVESLSGPDWRENFDVIELDWGHVENLEDLWDDINANCVSYLDMFIDIHEDASIEAENLPCLLQCIARIRAASSNIPEVLAFLERMHALTTAAQSRGVPVLFLF